MTDEWNDIAPPNEHEQKMGLLILFVVFVVAFLLGFIIRWLQQLSAAGVKSH
jgi:hypothetical protein